MQTEGIAAQPLRPSRSGILAVSGWGISVRVHRHRLVVAEGHGPLRREAELFRATSKLRRLVVIGHAGSVSLEAINWIHGVGASFVHLAPGGEVLLSSAAFGNDHPALRRAQALAAGAPVGLEVTKYLLRAKLEGQSSVLAKFFPDAEATRTEIAAALANLDGARTAEEARLAEARGAVAYWGAWGELPVAFASRDRGLVPPHWQSLGKRASEITGNPRLASNPASAALNLLYALGEIESRIGLLSVGLDPGLGVLHADQRNRDSMALDLLEAIRPEIDGYLLALIRSRTFARREFIELPNGCCRLAPDFARSLVQSMAIWRTSVGPVAERVAKLFAGSSPRQVEVPTRLTEFNRSRGRDGIRKKAPRTQQLTARIPNACRSCGLILSGHKRRYCDECLPEHKGESAEKGLAAGTARLAALRAEGIDPTQTGQARRKHADALARRRAEARAWEKTGGEMPDPEVFRREISPLLKGIPVRQMAKATGLSDFYCSEIRQGLRVPHPMWWEALRGLAQQLEDG